MPKDDRPSTFSALLRAELTRRCATNASYSLRAFARFLDVDHATLSQLIRGRRAWTSESVERVGRKLDLSDEAIAAFVSDARAAGRAAGANAPSVAADAACIVDEPIHHSILALMTAEGFRPDARFIARVLDASVDAVNVAVHRLASFGLLCMDSPSGWTDAASAGGLDPDGFERLVWGLAARRLARGGAPEPALSPPGPTPEPRPVRQFQILSRDPDATAAFYRDLFGWGVDDANALGYRQISTGPAGLGGGIWPSPPEAPSFVQLFVEVDDLPDAVERAAGLGARVLLPPQALPDGDAMAVLVDPQGLSFGVFTPARRD